MLKKEARQRQAIELLCTDMLVCAGNRRTPCSVQDRAAFGTVFERPIEYDPEIEAVTTDAGCKTSWFASGLLLLKSTKKPTPFIYSLLRAKVIPGTFCERKMLVGMSLQSLLV